MIPLTLTQLSYIVAVDAHGHFGKAAAACNITQPTLSMQVQKLERALGATLFDRGKAPVVTTDIGRVIVEQARTVLREASRITELRDEARGRVVGELRLGVIPTLAPYLIPRFVQPLGDKHPGLELVVQELVTADIITHLRQDQLDAGLIATTPRAPWLMQQRLFDEPFVAYVSAHHRLARHDVVRAADLALDDLWLLTEGHCLREQTLQLCHRRVRIARHDAEMGEVSPADGQTRGVRFESGNLETLKRLVEQGHGVTLLPALAADDLATGGQRKLLRPFAPPIPVRHVSLIRRRADLKRHLVDALLDALLASLPAHIQRAYPHRGRGSPAPGVTK